MEALVAILVIVGVVYTVHYYRIRARKLFHTSLPGGLVEIHFISYVPFSSGQRMWVARAYRKGKFMGSSLANPSRESLKNDILRILAFVKKAEEEGYEMTSILWSPKAVREEKTYHGFLKEDRWYECVYDPDFPRADDDGRCLCCEGWGCCACGHTGGY